MLSHSRFVWTFHALFFVAVLLMATAVSGPVSAQIVPEATEPNQLKIDATPATAVDIGAILDGSTLQSLLDDPGYDTWLVETAQQSQGSPPVPGLYRWTLELIESDNHVISIRGLSQDGTIGSGGVVMMGSDAPVQTSSPTQTAPTNSVSWYSNDSPSRVFMRVSRTGETQTETYEVRLDKVLVTPSATLGAFAPGDITVGTVGLVGFDTDIAILDEDYNIIAGAQNDDVFLGSGLQSRLTRSLTEGTYYVALSRFDFCSDQVSAADDDFALGEVMDYSNCLVSASSLNPTTFAVGVADAFGPEEVAVVTNSEDFAIAFVSFTVTSSSCAYRKGNADASEPFRGLLRRP